MAEDITEKSGYSVQPFVDQADMFEQVTSCARAVSVSVSVPVLHCAGVLCLRRRLLLLLPSLSRLCCLVSTVVRVCQLGERYHGPTNPSCLVSTVVRVCQLGERYHGPTNPSCLVSTVVRVWCLARVAEASVACLGGRCGGMVRVGCPV